MEILHQRLKAQTWDTMEEHQIGVNGLENNILVLNFAIRKREANEIKK